jgi:leucine dehydrogenase
MSGWTSLPEFDGHEKVVPLKDAKTGLAGFIAIHSTRLGPATGGTRVQSYRSEREALRDALRLSKAMTYKCALANVPFGGGKAVIMLPKKKYDRKALFRAYAIALNNLGGKFTTGEDVGVMQSDLDLLYKQSLYVNGKKSGDLWPWAAEGVFVSIQAALHHRFNSSALRGRRVAVKGLGKVGLELARLIIRAGGSVVAADIDARAVRAAKRMLPNISIVPSNRIHGEMCDVFAPCALQHDITVRSARVIRAGIICGAANNQIADRAALKILEKRGILYVPDYVSNAGGLINAISERVKGGKKRWVRRKVKDIRKTVELILRRSRRMKRQTLEIADILAHQRLAKGLV